jgi:hypothetical protein
MGEAIARFREMALSIRRACDERHSQPRGRAVKPAAAKKFAEECCEHFLDHEKAGMNYPARYVRGLCRRRDEAERHPDPPPPGEFDLPLYIEWLPEPFKSKGRGHSEARKALREAVKEAVQWGSLFPVVEVRIKALDAAADMLLQYAGAERYENPPAEDFEVDPEHGTTHWPPSREQADRDYIARHEEFAEALDALAPFIEEPPADAGSSPKQKTSAAKQATKRSRKGIGGRPEKFTMKFIREVVTARERDEKQAAKMRRPLPPIPGWLREYCDEHAINIREMFPPRSAGEEWSIRANRFWKAAKKRLREAETNRH